MTIVFTVADLKLMEKIDTMMLEANRVVATGPIKDGSPRRRY